MIRPTGRALGVLAAGLPVAALPTVLGDAQTHVYWVTAIVLFALALVIELAFLPAARCLDLQVTGPTQHYFGDELELLVRGAATRSMPVLLQVTLTGSAAWPATVLVPFRAGETTQIVMTVRPERRGILRCPAAHTSWTGPMGLLRLERAWPMALAIQVVPNARLVREQALQMASRRDSRSGLRVERYLGDGSEFESLRDYVLGMDRRAIDWKASARHRQLLCREFRAERNHSVVLCLDTGRSMREPLSNLPRLDHAMQASLQLGHVCLRTGDRVGLHAFADRPQQYLAPQAGMQMLKALQERMATLDYGTGETNFTLGMTDLLQRLRRRSLVVMFTDFTDDIHAQLMLRNVRLLARRHVLLFVAMRDPLLDELTRRAPNDLADVQRAVVADGLQRERQVVIEQIRRAGAHIIDAGVGEIGPALVERYLAVKRRELV